jgi:hypothetical protein
MKVLNLRCAQEHRFEGWFASEDDYASQADRGLVECPVCGDKAIVRLPSAPRLNVSKQRGESEVTDPQLQRQQLWMRALRHVMDNTEDVGERFPEEARRIHYGEVPSHAIRGRATPEDTDALREEGIEVMAIEVPEALKGPVQ